jgi:hypothetical protein
VIVDSAVCAAGGEKRPVDSGPIALLIVNPHSNELRFSPISGKSCLKMARFLRQPQG